ncbi:hypothetical protein [Amycolatopsis sp. NPDC051903]|uniref:hypothetical protein n=1 Tax=Amycolatopsis sp. NPDC051903 TaxID=3363936 RepID=UPI003798089A
MHAWWPLATGAAVFAVLALLHLRRSALSQAVAEREEPGTVAPVKRRARHRADEADPLARYPVARQRPVPNALITAAGDETPTQPFALPQPRPREPVREAWPTAAPPRPTPARRGRKRTGKIITDPVWPGPPASRSRPAVPDPSGRGRKRRRQDSGNEEHSDD